jgi:PadR family transcriptional regulator AphA
MSLKFGLLGLIAERPRSGYELTQTFASSLNYVWPASHSQIYPELARLVDEGLIRQAEEGPRGRKRYAITVKGKRSLRHWLTRTEPNRATRNEAFLRLFFLWFLSPEECERYLQGELDFHRRGLAEYEQVAERIDEALDVGQAEAWGRLPIELGLHYKESLIEFYKYALRQVRRQRRAAARSSRATAS